MSDQDVVSFLSFWLDAGVETAYAETALDRRRLSAPPARPAAPPVLSGDAAREIREASAGPRLEPAPKPFSLAATLQDLQAEVEALRGSRRKGDCGERTVFGRGAEGGEVMVIGEAPSAEDEAAGAPFSGRAGDLLDRMLIAAGLGETAYLTNTVFWRPPGDRPASREDQLACQPYLERALILIKPRLVVMLGAGAAKFLLDADGGVVALRGRRFDFSPVGAGLTLPAAVTFSPQMLLRHPLLKKPVWFDLLAASQALGDMAVSAADENV